MSGVATAYIRLLGICGHVRRRLHRNPDTHFESTAPFFREQFLRAERKDAVGFRLFEKGIQALWLNPNP